MTSESMQILSTWRTEIQSSLEQAQALLPGLEAEYAATTAAARATESTRELPQILDVTFKRLASPLAQRVGALRVEGDAARTRVTRALFDLEKKRGEIKENEIALRQADHMLESEDAREEAA